MKRTIASLSSLSRQQLALGAFISVLPVLSLAYQGAEFVRVAVLALPIMLVLWWSHQNSYVRRIQLATAFCVAVLFMLDGVVRGFIFQAFNAAPDSTMVMTALANTSPAESGEFFNAHWPRLMSWKLALAAALGLNALFLWSWWLGGQRQARTARTLNAALLLLSLLFAFALALKPWRSFHPLSFWPKFISSLQDMNDDWADLQTQGALLKQRANDQAPVLSSGSPETVVLIISESINRNHLSLYGYPRQTTPELEARRRLDPEAFKIFNHAWSADAATVAALQNFFYFGSPTDGQRQHLMTLAHAAGYQTTWISNQDDRAIQYEHAHLADRVHMLNHVPGRSTAALDHHVLPLLEDALRKGAQRQLIVIHLLGAHPHYSSRYPKDLPVFEGTKDNVYQALKKDGRSFWTRKMRNEYDSALHYHDSVVSTTLDMAQRWGGKNTAWIYLSDHGQEVGSYSNRIGHSATSANGYRIPLVMWGEATKSIPEHLQKVPVRADWLGHSVMRLLGLQWQGHRPEHDFMDPSYHWQQPASHPPNVDPLS